MAVYNDRCYIVADGAGGPGLQVVDLRFIDSAWPPQAADINTTDLGVGFQTAHNIVANPDSGFLYLCGSNEELNYGRGLVASLHCVRPGRTALVDDVRLKPRVRAESGTRGDELDRRAERACADRSAESDAWGLVGGRALARGGTWRVVDGVRY